MNQLRVRAAPVPASRTAFTSGDWRLLHLKSAPEKNKIVKA